MVIRLSLFGASSCSCDLGRPFFFRAGPPLALSQRLVIAFDVPRAEDSPVLGLAAVFSVKPFFGRTTFGSCFSGLFFFLPPPPRQSLFFLYFILNRACVCSLFSPPLPALMTLTSTSHGSVWLLSCTYGPLSFLVNPLHFPLFSQGRDLFPSPV